ncbi:MAG: M23 family metallopeptidase [Clostridia bacterium]|nr:M23 family metallopeptidase [Clostridia bacterium]
MRKVTETRETKKGRTPRILTVQLVVCLLLLGFLVLAMQFHAPVFETLKKEFSGRMEKDLDLKAVTFFAKENKVTTVDGPAETSAADESTAAETENEELTEPDTAGAGGVDLTGAQVSALVNSELYEIGERAVMPVSGATVTSEFGERIHPIYGTQGFHAGKDLAVPEGSPIYAALDGEVIGAGWGESAGNYVKLRHDDGLETLYCHCCRLNVEEGVRVRKGDVIAFVGQTGLATGPHLHFEVRIDGVRSDPDCLLKDACVVA